MYKIQKNKREKFELIELATELKINEYDTHSEAKSQYNKFKGGQAFAGFTPGFFLIKFNKGS